MPKGQGSSILWRRVLIGAQGTRNGKIVCHVWMGKDGLWRGSATGIKEFSLAPSSGKPMHGKLS